MSEDLGRRILRRLGPAHHVQRELLDDDGRPLGFVQVDPAIAPAQLEALRQLFLALRAHYAADPP